MNTISILGSTIKMETVAEVLKRCEEQGFAEKFIVRNNALYAPSLNKVYSPDRVRIVDTYRYEGLTDPDDNTILYAIICPDGVKGTVIDAYGVYSAGIFSQPSKQT